MTELKTLNEIILNEHDGTWPSKDTAVIFLLAVKQEAIKWLLHALKKRKNMFKMFMDFFNITDEDMAANHEGES